MIRILKELKPFSIIILVIIGLLFAQAMTDLALPDYMSNIVNVGIQQNGIEDVVPQIIRISEMEKIKMFLTEEEKELVNNSYRIVNKDRDNLNEKEYKDFIKRYPDLVKEEFLILNTDNKEDIEMMNSFLGKAMLTVLGVEMGRPQGIASSDEIKMDNPFSNLPEGTDPFMVLQNLPKEQLEDMRAEVDKQFEILPESMVNQSAISYIKSEYETIGIDMEDTQTKYVLSTGGKMLGIALLGMIASIIVGFLASRVSASLGRNLRDKVFTKVTTFSNAELNDFSTASLITRSTNDIQQVQQFTVMMLRMVFYAPILGVGGVLRALETNTSMAWIVGVAVIGILILVATLFTIAIPKFKIVQKLVDKVNLVMRESLNGSLVIRAFSTQKHEEERFDKANQDLTKTNLFVSRLMTAMMPTMMFIMNGVILLIVWVGAKEIDQGAIQVGDMMAFMQYAMQIIMSFLMLSMVSIILPRASVSAGRIGEILDKELTIIDSENAIGLKEDIDGTLEFRNVSFKYPGAEECVLKDLSFTAKPGETTAFIGSTGSGKSTLINLIPRFFDVTKGEILLDGINIKDIKLHDLREKIGYVPQKGTLFTGTIESNIRYGKNHDVNEEGVLKAIEISQSKEFIDDKTDGINSEISQGGTNVSGGQKQRLSIARALAKRPKILIFDDSFSALDFKTDSMLRESINENIKDRTMLIVAQRINTIINAEKIIVLDEGQIVGMGTHKELLKTSSIYKQIALSQLSEEELAI